jgi:hypothetical protein
LLPTTNIKTNPHINNIKKVINYKNIRDFNDNSPEGKLLLMALAILTSINVEDIKDNKWGGMVHPDDALMKVQDLTNQIYYEEEWKMEQIKIKRDTKINKILN